MAGAMQVLCKLKNILPQLIHKAPITIFKNAVGLSTSVFNEHKKFTVNLISIAQCRSFHVSNVKQDLMDFFDDPKNWGEPEVRTGRAWRKDDLRIKSNSDLHKLWYVLLKEKNMLLTMETEYKRLAERMPNPERIYKVEESMENLESVVRERNRAYNLLETGHDGERPTQLVEDVLGMHRFYRLKEHTIPFYMNKKWRENVKFNHWDPKHVVNFKRQLRERRIKLRNSENKRRARYVTRILEKYPNASDDAILEKYPGVHLARLRAKLDK